MNIDVTERDREEARRSIERLARGIIDDSGIDAPDDGETTGLKRAARQYAEARRAAARSRAAARRKKASTAV
jgi:hypothetical protein